VNIKLSSKATLILLIFLTFSSLFLGFYRNQWQVVRPKKFSLFQKDVEAYVIARMVLSRQNGLFSDGGLLGWGDVDPSDVNEDDYQHQYDIYLKGLTFQTYWAKESHPGFQGIFFSALDRISPFSPIRNLTLFRMFAAGLFAAVLAGLVLWFYWELGWLSALFVFVSIVVSQWMTLFGRILFFLSGLFYLPMLILLFRLHSEKTGDQLTNTGLFGLVFSFVLLKCLFNGYDFIIPTLGMVASPIVFYGVLKKWNKAQFVKRFMLVVIAALTAIFASLLILSFQIMFASGSLWEGVNSSLETINRRTISNPDLPSSYEAVNMASLWSILKIYLSESYFSNLRVPYFAIIILFAIVSASHLLVNKINPQEGIQSSRGSALLVVTWFSLLGPLGWYTIFKSVAYFHTHMNYLPWHMPFTLFGFGMCGFVIQTLLSSDRWRTLK